MPREKRKKSQNSSSKSARLKQERVENFAALGIDEMKNVENVNTNNAILSDPMNEKAEKAREPREKRKTSQNSSSKSARLKQERVENFAPLGIDEMKNVENVKTNNAILSYPMNEKAEKAREPRVIFILENAPLHKGLVGKKWKILDSRRDQHFLLKHKKNLKDFRPENVHQPLLDIFDSRVNKVGIIEAVYVKIDNGVLFEIKPHARIPRTYNRFCGLILDLLRKSCLRAEDTKEVLFRVLKEPLSQHLPSNSHIIGVSNGLERLVDLENHVCAASDDKNLVFVVSAMDHKKINTHTDDMISVSHYPLVPIGFIGMICEALEHKWTVEPPSH